MLWLFVPDAPLIPTLFCDAMIVCPRCPTHPNTFLRCYDCLSQMSHSSQHFSAMLWLFVPDVSLISTLFCDAMIVCPRCPTHPNTFLRCYDCLSQMSHSSQHFSEMLSHMSHSSQYFSAMLCLFVPDVPLIPTLFCDAMIVCPRCPTHPTTFLQCYDCLSQMSYSSQHFLRCCDCLSQMSHSSQQFSAMLWLFVPDVPLILTRFCDAMIVCPRCPTHPNTFLRCYDCLSQMSHSSQHVSAMLWLFVPDVPLIPTLFCDAMIVCPRCLTHLYTFLRCYDCLSQMSHSS